MTRISDIIRDGTCTSNLGEHLRGHYPDLPEGYPITLAALRALPAGLLLLAITRRLPPRDWLGALSCWEH